MAPETFTEIGNDNRKWIGWIVAGVVLVAVIAVCALVTRPRATQPLEPAPGRQSNATSLASSRSTTATGLSANAGSVAPRTGGVNTLPGAAIGPNGYPGVGPGGRGGYPGGANSSSAPGNGAALNSGISGNSPTESHITGNGVMGNPGSGNPAPIGK